MLLWFSFQSFLELYLTFDIKKKIECVVAWFFQSYLIMVIFFSSLTLLWFFSFEFKDIVFRKHSKDSQFKGLSDTDF